MTLYLRIIEYFSYFTGPYTYCSLPFIAQPMYPIYLWAVVFIRYSRESLTIPRIELLLGTDMN